MLQHVVTHFHSFTWLNAAKYLGSSENIFIKTNRGLNIFSWWLPIQFHLTKLYIWMVKEINIPASNMCTITSWREAQNKMESDDYNRTTWGRSADGTRVPNLSYCRLNSGSPNASKTTWYIHSSLFDSQTKVYAPSYKASSNNLHSSLFDSQANVTTQRY